MKISELKLDQKQEIVLLLERIEERETKSGGAFCKFTLTDGEKEISANLWNTKKEEVRVPEKSLIIAEIYVKLYQDQLSYEVYKYGPASAESRIEDYVLSAPMDPVRMFEDLKVLMRKQVPKNFQSPCSDLLDLTMSLLDDNRQKILYWSAAKTMHHNCRAGWLYHTYRMAYAAVMLMKIYPVDRELLLAGTILHDIGKLEELETDNLGIAEYTIEGSLFGHSLLGIEMIDRKIVEEETEGIKYDPEKVKLLKHLVASHHGEQEYGAISGPAVPEAMLLHELDMIDSRMYMFEQALNDLQPGEMSDKIFGLGGRVYKEVTE
uniref:3'-5' exoribonuclease YhaM family protein n=1 Tax=Lachnoclostridium phocaeense TaxID=1871021 RepID=UPI0026DB661E|nr:HD domain-containing protein [Lachnoclostridium phocaeense]